MNYFYTITSSNYYWITEKSIKSFLKNCDSKEIYHIYCVDNIENKLIDSRIIYKDISEVMNKVGYSIEKLGISSYCMFSKSVFDLIEKKSIYEKIIFADSDILYFRDIVQYINELDCNTIYTCMNLNKDKKKKYTHPNSLNSGFICIPRKHANDFFIKWRMEMERLIIKENIIKNVDQIALRNIDGDLKSIRIPLTVLSLKTRRDNCYACHYYKLRKRNRQLFEDDYREYIINNK